uniref:hypothetical protein n=1 Tax=Brevibacillus brevis TaxID=1393 RepID=UPI000562FF54
WAPEALGLEIHFFHVAYAFLKRSKKKRLVFISGRLLRAHLQNVVKAIHTSIAVRKHVAGLHPTTIAGRQQVFLKEIPLPKRGILLPSN